MCNFCSAIITKDHIFFGWSDGPSKMDSHETIIYLHKLHADGAHGPNIVRVECVPPNPGAPLNKWVYRVDQNALPGRYDSGRDERRARHAIEKSKIGPALAEYEKVKTGVGWVAAPAAKSAELPELRLFPKARKLDIPADATDLDVIQIAIRFERRGHDMYVKAASAIDDLTGKSVYEYLAQWEDRHRDLLQRALDQLSADGTWLLLEHEKPLLDGGA